MVLIDPKAGGVLGVILDVGYKYQMTDIGAALLLDSQWKNIILLKKEKSNTRKYGRQTQPGLTCLKNNNKNINLQYG